jgi:hypothetical protein
VRVEATSLGFWMFIHRIEQGANAQNCSLDDWVLFLRSEKTKSHHNS